MTAVLMAAIAERESEVSERAVALAKLRQALGRVEADLAKVREIRDGRIEDVPPEQLDEYLEAMRTADSDLANLRRVKKELDRRISRESSEHTLAAQDLARKKTNLAALAHKDEVLLGLRAALSPLDDLAEDRATRNAHNGVVADLLGLRGRILESIKLIEKYW